MPIHPLLSRRRLSRHHCRKCSIDTRKLDEYYVVHDELWQGVGDRWKIPLDQYNQSGMLCVGCFESLLGRKLVKADFRQCLVNELEGPWPKSFRLFCRLTEEAVT